MGYLSLAATDTDTCLKIKILADTNKGKKTHGDTNSVDTGTTDSPYQYRYQFNTSIFQSKSVNEGAIKQKHM